MALELVTPLPPGAASHTRLAKHGARLVVLREILDGTDCSWPDPAPGLVTLQEVGELQGKRHALFEWVPGVTLRDVVAALEAGSNPVPLGLVARAVIDAARALSAIRPLRAHGGLSDAALQLGFDGRVSVLDWGAPRVGRFRPLGRVNYAADVFALGGVVHATLTGFRGEYAGAPGTLPPPSTSHPEATPALDDVVMRALSPQPDARQHDVGALADELEAVLGEQLFTTLQVADLVQSLFRERIKLLQSLGGLTAPHPSEHLEAVLPIPTGTQPGTPVRPTVPWESGEVPRVEPASEPTLPRVISPELKAELTQPRVASSELVPRTEPPSEPTLPRIASSEVVPRAELPSEPTLPRLASSEVVPRTEPPSEPTLPRVNSSELVPRASAPRPALADSTPDTDPRAVRPADTHEDTDPRGRPLDEGLDPTLPRLRSAVQPRLDRRADVDTAPRARAPKPADSLVEDTGPTPQLPPRPRNTSESERLRARGQERLRTPPSGVGVTILGEEPAGLDEPTAVRARPKPVIADTAQSLTPVRPVSGSLDALDPLDDFEAPLTQASPVDPAPRGGGLRVVMVVLLVLVVGIAAAVVVKAMRASAVPPPEVVLDEDAGAPEPEVAPAVVEVPDAGEAIAEEDAGPTAEPEDAGLVAEVDAGQPEVDAGTPDAGAKPAKKPAKKPVKKPTKKKRRR